MSYLTGQTATVNIGPIKDVRTSTPFDPENLKVTLVQPDGEIAFEWSWPADDEVIRTDVGTFHINVPLPEPTILRGRWTWGEDDEIGAEKFVLVATDDFLFASVQDVQARLGGEELTDGQVDQVLGLLTSATGLILDAAGKDQEWALALETIPATLRTVCIETVARVTLNPRGLRYSQKQLGSYGHSETFIGDGSLSLTKDEERDIRRAVRSGTTFQSLTLRTPYSGDDEVSAMDFFQTSP